MSRDKKEFALKLATSVYVCVRVCVCVCAFHDTRNFFFCSLNCAFVLLFLLICGQRIAQLKFNEVWKKLNRRLIPYAGHWAENLFNLFSIALLHSVVFFNTHDLINDLNQNHIFHADLEFYNATGNTTVSERKKETSQHVEFLSLMPHLLLYWQWTQFIRYLFGVCEMERI